MIVEKKMALLDTHWSSRLNSVLGRLGQSRGRSSPHMTAGTNQLWNLDTYKLWKLLHLQAFMYIKGFPDVSQLLMCAVRIPFYLFTQLCVLFIIIACYCFVFGSDSHFLQTASYSFLTTLHSSLPGYDIVENVFFNVWMSENDVISFAVTLAIWPR